MKKIITSFFTLALVAITFSSCSQETPIPDSSQSNTLQDSSQSNTIQDSSKSNTIQDSSKSNTIQDSSKSDTILDSSQSNTVAAYYNHVMETDIGYYYNNSNVYYSGVPLSLHYYDKGAGKNIFLCTKPECQHNGSSFCPATNSKITVYNTALYGDYLYMTGTENQTDFSIYRAKNNGSELTKLVDFIKLPPNSYSADYISKIETFLVQNGKAYLTYGVVNRMDYRIGINGIITVDLSTLKCEKIEEIDLADDFTINNVKASGDYVYYLTVKNGSALCYIKRYNTVDKTLETIPLPVKDGYITNMYIYGYVIIGDEIWISCKTRKNLNEKEKSCLAYNLTSGEMREIEIQINDNNLKDSVIEPYRNVNSDIMYDGKYLYISEYDWKDYGNFTVSIYELDGTRLAEFPVNLSEMNSFTFYCLNVLNGKVYLQTKTEMKSCSVQDIIDGNFAWTTEFEFKGMMKMY